MANLSPAVRRDIDRRKHKIGGRIEGLAFALGVLESVTQDEDGIAEAYEAIESAMHAWQNKR